MDYHASLSVVYDTGYSVKRGNRGEDFQTVDQRRPYYSTDYACPSILCKVKMFHMQPIHMYLWKKKEPDCKNCFLAGLN